MKILFFHNEFNHFFQQKLISLFEFVYINSIEYTNINIRFFFVRKEIFKCTVQRVPEELGFRKTLIYVIFKNREEIKSQYSSITKTTKICFI